MTTVGLLRTVPSLAATFDGLLGGQAADLRRVRVVDAWLPGTARLGTRTLTSLAELVEDGA
jgi:hypothetical protein